MKQEEVNQFVKELVEINELAWNLRCRVEEVFKENETFYSKYIQAISTEDNKEVFDAIVSEFIKFDKNDERFVEGLNSDAYIDKFQELAYEVQEIIDDL